MYTMNKLLKTYWIAMVKIEPLEILMMPAQTEKLFREP